MVLALAVLLVFCALDSPSGAGGVEIVIAQTADAVSLDPQKQSDTVTGNVCHNIFDPLILRDRDMSLKPLLATEWKQLSDLEWEVSLRKGVKFHNGEDFNAAAVKFTFDRVVNPEKKNLAASYFTTIQSCDVIDDYTVKFTTKQIEPIFLARLTNLFILPPQYVTEAGDEKFAQNPVGTGPFKFVEWVRADRVLLTANEGYWGGKPPIDMVTFKPVPEVSTQIAGLQNGQLDLVPSFSSDLLEALKRTPGVQIRTTSAARMQMLNFNFGTELGKNRDFRLAIAHAIQRDPIAQDLLNGYGTPIDIPISKIIPNQPTDVKALPYDISKAKEHLKAAGYPNGLDIELVCQSGVAPFDRDIAQVIASQLEEAGIRATVKPMEQAAYLEARAARTISPVYQLSGNNVWFDIDPQLVAFFSTNGALSTISSEKIDELIKKGVSTTDAKARYEIYKETFTFIRDEALSVPIIQYELIAATSSKIEWQPRPDGRIRVAEMTPKN